MKRALNRMRGSGIAGWAAWTCALALAGGMAAPGAASAQTTTKQQAIELITLSGINRTLEDYSDRIRLELIKREDTIPKDVMGRLKSMMLAAFHPARLSSQYVTALQKDMEPRVAQTGLDWFKSPLGLRLTRLEVEAASREGRKQKDLWVKRMGSAPPVKERMDLIVRLVRASNYAPVMAEGDVIAFEPIIQTENAAKPEGQQKQQQDVQAMLANMRSGLLAKKAQERVVELLYAYRQVEDVDLRRYATFLESHAGIAYTDRMNAALLTALRQSNDWIASRFGELFRRRRNHRRAAGGGAGTYKEREPWAAPGRRDGGDGRAWRSRWRR